MADSTYVTELETQVRILGDRVVRLNTENEQLQESNRQSKAQAGISPRLQRERDAAVQQAEKLKQELAGESKRRADAERLVAALERELAAKESLLERYRAEANLSERLSNAEPLLGSLHEAVLNISRRDS